MVRLPEGWEQNRRKINARAPEGGKGLGRTEEQWEGEATSQRPRKLDQSGWQHQRKQRGPERKGLQQVIWFGDIRWPLSKCRMGERRSDIMTWDVNRKYWNRAKNRTVRDPATSTIWDFHLRPIVYNSFLVSWLLFCIILAGSPAGPIIFGQRLIWRFLWSCFLKHWNWQTLSKVDYPSECRGASSIRL